LQGQVLRALQEERHSTPEFFEFRVNDRIKEAGIWRLTIEAEGSGRRRGSVLDEALEGCKVWWVAQVGERKLTCQGEVLSVVPAQGAINVVDCTRDFEASVERIRVYTSDYLQVLAGIWRSRLHVGFHGWLNQFLTNNMSDHSRKLDASRFPALRGAQLRVFESLEHDVSYLWGPPGTGKTFTLGCLIAEYMLSRAGKVLIVSGTNTAVDQALVSVDRALERLKTPKAEGLRQKCRRVGTRFEAGKYSGREHLIHDESKELIRKLAHLERHKPDAEQAKEYAAWKRECDGIRQALKTTVLRVIEASRVVAMTTTRFFYFVAACLEAAVPIPKFDWIVFDEASQVSKIHAITASSFGKQVLFTGDPKQLSPISVSEKPEAEFWLGESMFAFRDGEFEAEDVYFLNEQTRMVEPICRVVSELFYDGKLCLAQEVQRDAQWWRERRMFSVSRSDFRDFNREFISVLKVTEQATWSKKYQSLIRHQSAVLIADFVQNLVHFSDGCTQEHITVLTPFRGQRILIQSELKKRDLQKVSVSTVHKSQGGENHTIVFDPVSALNAFLRETENDDAPRLVNVALSRAKTKLVLALSAEDGQNPLFDQLLLVIEKLRFSGELFVKSDIGVRARARR
jgi:hypothetical protein